MTETDWFRVVNIILAIIGATLLAFRARSQWWRWTARTKFLWQALLLFCVLVVFGSLEILLGTTFLRVPLTTVALVWVVLGGLMRGGYTVDEVHATRPPGEVEQGSESEQQDDGETVGQRHP